MARSAPPVTLEGASQKACQCWLHKVCTLANMIFSQDKH